jgi:hypothetical protein
LFIDKTKYYVNDIENFNNYSSNGWDLLEDKQLKVIAKALNINTEEAQEKIITVHVLRIIQKIKKIQTWLISCIKFAN